MRERFFFLTLSKNARKYLKHPFCEKSEKRDGIPIPFYHPTPTKQLHYIKFTWREDKNLLTFCWPYRHRNLCRHYKSHISSDFYIQNLMLQSPKPNVKSSRWVKPWHQFRFWACWLAADGDSSGAQRLAFTLHLTWGAFFFLSFFLIFLFLPYATGDSESKLFHEDHMLRETHDGKWMARSCLISLGDVLQT